MVKKYIFVCALLFSSVAISGVQRPQVSLWSKLFGGNADRSLWTALLDKDKDAVIKALNAGANPNLILIAGVSNRSVASVAITNNWPDVVDLMLDYGLDPKNSTLLIAAVRKGFPVSIVQRLLQNGVDPNSFDELDRTALMHANRSEVAQVLLEAGARVDLANKQGQTALHVQVNDPGIPGIVALLLDQGADVNAKDKRDITPLHAVAAGGSLNVAKLLVSRGADVNATAGLGVTPLLIAQVLGNAPVYYYLSSLNDHE